MAADYTSPTRLKTWLQAVPAPAVLTNKEKAYGQWIAQLLQSQLGIELAPLFYKTGQTQWPLTLRADVIEALDEYFARFVDNSNAAAE